MCGEGSMSVDEQRDIDAFVSREVVYCVSSLMYQVGQHMEDAARIFEEDYDTLMELYERVDYREALEDALVEDHDLIEKAADDLHGLLALVVLTPENEARFFEDNGLDIEDREGVWPPVNCDAHALLYLTKKQVRDLVSRLLDSLDESDLPGMCDMLRVDTDEYRDEVYEHWVVSDWLGRKLREQGEVVGEFCGLTVWGRCCTGQAISLDGVIERIWRSLS